MLRWTKFALATLLLLAAGCRENPEAPDLPQALPLSLLALGDSYTVGQSVAPQWSWPRQLADSLATGGDTLQTVDVIAQTGWTTRDLLDAVREKRAAGELLEPYGLVTLMIGVNNQFQGLDPALFEAEMDTLIDLAVELAGGRPAGVLGFSIPDYGVTPVGGLFDAELIASEIAAFNTALGGCFAERGVAMLDITTCSLEAADDPALVARDGLHFSAAMYSRWVSLMLPAVRQFLALDH